MTADAETLEQKINAVRVKLGGAKRIADGEVFGQKDEASRDRARSDVRKFGDQLAALLAEKAGQ